jgi:hypothetical protein
MTAWMSDRVVIVSILKKAQSHDTGYLLMTYP